MSGERIWYSYDPEHRTTLHRTAEEAESAAGEDMAYHRDCAESDHWHEDIDALSWGEMVRHGEARRVERTEPTEDRPDGTEEWALVPVADATEPGATIGRALCPCCGADLEVMHGDEPGALGVLGTPDPGAADAIRLLAVSLSECVRILRPVVNGDMVCMAGVLAGRPIVERAEALLAQADRP